MLTKNTKLEFNYNSFISSKLSFLTSHFPYKQFEDCLLLDNHLKITTKLMLEVTHPDSADNMFEVTAT